MSGAEADAAFTFRTLDPRTLIEITPRIRATYFPNEPEEDSTDYFFDAVIADTTQRRRTGFGLGLSREDVVRSELVGTDFEGDLGDPQEVDSGLAVERNRRDLIRANPYFEYDATERSFIRFDAQYVDAQFDRQIENVHRDFSDLAFSAGYGYRVSPRSRLVVRALASRFDTSMRTDAYGGEARWETDFSPSSRFYVSAGAERTEPEGGGESHTSWVGGVGGRWSSPRNTLFVDLTSDVRPVSAGTVVERHQLRLSIDHAVTPRFSVDLGVRMSRDEDIEDSGRYPTRDYATATAGFEWRWQRNLSLYAQYGYVWQEYADEPSDASANRVFIGVVYEPKRRD